MAAIERIGLLSIALIAIGLGSYTGHLHTALNRWRDLQISIRLILTIVFGWPYIAYVSPLLIEIWAWTTGTIYGFGGEFLITEIQTQLILVTISLICAQWVYFRLKLDRFKEQIIQ